MERISNCLKCPAIFLGAKLPGVIAFRLEKVMADKSPKQKVTSDKNMKNAFMMIVSK